MNPKHGVINTGPLIALAAGLGTWSALDDLGLDLQVPQAVMDELQAGPVGTPGRDLTLPDCATIHPATQSTSWLP